MARKLKFGSPAYRKKYLGKARKNKPKRKAAQRKRTASHRRGTRAKKKRMSEILRGNPPSTWTKARMFRVVNKNGCKVLEVKK